MKIVSTSFDYKNIHKETWLSPNGKTKNQIDYVLIEMKHLKRVTDVRSYRGADADSDHFLVITKLNKDKPPRIEQDKKTVKIRFRKIEGRDQSKSLPTRN